MNVHLVRLLTWSLCLSSWIFSDLAITRVLKHRRLWNAGSARIWGVAYPVGDGGTGKTTFVKVCSMVALSA